MMLELHILKYRGVSALALQWHVTVSKLLVTLLSNPGSVVYLWHCGLGLHTSSVTAPLNLGARQEGNMVDESSGNACCIDLLE